jgi:hypothetical protein
MSQDNIEVVRELYAAWACDQFLASPELMDPEVEYVNPDGAVEPRGVQPGGRESV